LTSSGSDAKVALTISVAELTFQTRQVETYTAKAIEVLTAAWESGLDAVAGIEGALFTGLLDEDEHGFLLNMLAPSVSTSDLAGGGRPAQATSARKSVGPFTAVVSARSACSTSARRYTFSRSGGRCGSPST
jgi:hypothetical protein